MKCQVVSFHCVLKNKLGRILSSTFNHEVITQPGRGDDLLTGLAEGMQNLVKGETRSISLSAEQAYGFYDPRKVIVRAEDELPSGLRIGDQVMVNRREGQIEPFRVTEKLGGLITLDANHPLAGQDLVFEIVATEARDATPDEISDDEQIGPH